MSYEGGYTSAVNSATNRQGQDAQRQAAMQQMVQAALMFQQQQEMQKRKAAAQQALPGLMAQLAPPPAGGPQPPPPGASSMPMAPPGAPPPAAAAPGMGQLPPPPGVGFASPAGAGAAGPQKPMNGPPGAAPGAGGPPMPTPGWKSLPAPPEAAAPPGSIPPPPGEGAVVPKQLLSVTDLAKSLAAKGIKGQEAFDLMEAWKPFMDSENKQQLDQMKLHNSAQQAALKTYAQIIRDAETKRHHGELEAQGEKRLKQGDQRINIHVGGGASKMSADAIDDAATQFRKTGVIPSAFRDKESRAVVQNRAAEQRRELGTTAEGEVGDRVDLKAVQSAYTAITKDLASIRPYKVMLDKNGDIAIELAKKAIATDKKFANKGINWLRQNATDNPDVAEFLAQAQIISTEAARVLNNPRLVGQLTDSARHEMQEIINGNMPLNSFARVIQRMQKDGENRVSAMQAEADDLKKRAGGGGGSAPAPAVGGKPKGDYVELRKTADGRTLGKKADGTVEEVK